jgi:starch phosphorylase
VGRHPTILGVPHDIPTAGYGTGTVNLLRLWASKSTEDFDLAAFNRGGYVEAVREKAISETVSKVLYPNDKTEAGKELRLVQQYFFVACSLRDIIRRTSAAGNSWENFARQGGDPAQRHAPGHRRRRAHAHPRRRGGCSLGRRLGDLPAHLRLHQPHPAARGAGAWSVPPFRAVLPRHLQIIYEINRRFLEASRRGQVARRRRQSAPAPSSRKGGPNMVRMAISPPSAAHTVNGVAALHTDC